VRLGEDSAAVKAVSKSRASETFKPIADRFLAHKKKSLSPKYYDDMERHLLVDAKPLHGLAVAGIKRRDIAELLSSIRDGHSDSTANHVRASLSGFFTWTMKEGLLGDEAANPVTYTNKTADVKRDRVLLWSELREIWAALLEDEDDYSDIVRLLMLSAQRREEIGSLASITFLAVPRHSCRPFTAYRGLRAVTAHKLAPSGRYIAARIHQRPRYALGEGAVSLAAIGRGIASPRAWPALASGAGRTAARAKPCRLLRLRRWR
jgi:integrase